MLSANYSIGKQNKIKQKEEQKAQNKFLEAEK